MNKLTKGRVPFQYEYDILQPKGNNEMVWVHQDRLWELLSLLSDELNNRYDDKIKKIFPSWNYKYVDSE
jgi:hypothetical protein